VVSVFVERAQDTDAHVARLAVEANCLVAVLTTLDVFLRLDVEQRMTARHLPETPTELRPKNLVRAHGRIRDLQWRVHVVGARTEGLGDEVLRS